MKYPVGAKLKVVQVLHGASLDEGDIVTVLQYGDDDGFDQDCYGVISPHDNLKWYLWDDEVAPATRLDWLKGLNSEETAQAIVDIISQYKDAESLTTAISEYLNSSM